MPGRERLLGCGLLTLLTQGSHRINQTITLRLHGCDPPLRRGSPQLPISWGSEVRGPSAPCPVLHAFREGRGSPQPGGSPIPHFSIRRFSKALKRSSLCRVLGGGPGEAKTPCKGRLSREGGVGGVSGRLPRAFLGQRATFRSPQRTGWQTRIRVNARCGWLCRRRPRFRGNRPSYLGEKEIKTCAGSRGVKRVMADCS